MLAKAVNFTRSQLTSSPLVNFTKRGVYKPGTEPKVFVNKNTKVICQGITGKHVSINKISSLHNFFPIGSVNNKQYYRVLSTPNKLLPTALRWLVVSTTVRLAALT